MERKDQLTVEPYTGPRRTGEPAYTYMGVQMLKQVVNTWSDVVLLRKAFEYDQWTLANKPEQYTRGNLFAQIAIARLLEEI